MSEKPDTPYFGVKSKMIASVGGSCVAMCVGVEVAENIGIVSDTNAATTQALLIAGHTLTAILTLLSKNQST